MSATTTVSNENVPYVAKEIKEQLAKSKKIVRDANQDRVYIVTGREGHGKSKLSQQLAFELDPTLCLADVCFNSYEFEHRIRTVDRYKAVIFDEAFNGLSSKSALSKENKRLVRLLMECRQKNLFVFIVLPTIFLLEKYVAVFRAHALFNVNISSKNYKLRYYKVYNYHNKKLLYIYGKDNMSYDFPRIHKMHRFYNKTPPTINEEEYNKKKLDSFMQMEKEMEKEDKYLIQRNKIIKLWVESMDISLITAEKMLKTVGIELDRSGIGKIVNEYKQKNTDVSQT